MLLLIEPHSGSSSDSPPVKTIDMFDQLEIYPGSKINHFKQIHKKTKLPYSEMVRATWYTCPSLFIDFLVLHIPPFFDGHSSSSMMNRGIEKLRNSASPSISSQEG